MKYNKHYHPHHIERLQELQGRPLATFWQRAMALAIDAIVCTILLMLILLAYALVVAAVRYRMEGGVRKFYVSFGGDSFNLVLELVIPIVYAGILVYLTQGKTVGKWIMGIRVVSITHQRISFIHSAERAMAYTTSILEFGFGFFQYFMNVNHRTLGDKVGETIVIRDRLSKKEKQKPLEEREEETTNVVQVEPLLDEEAIALA